MSLEDEDGRERLRSRAGCWPRRTGSAFRTVLDAIARAWRTSLRVAAVLALPLGPALAQAPDFPRRAVHIVVPFAAGGASDLTARIVGEKMADVLGQPVIVDNRTGAGGMIGAQFVSHAAADGYTLLLAANSFVINTLVREKASYDAITSFTPVAMLVQSPFLLTVNPALGAKSFADFLRIARAQPGKLRFAAAGPGASPHIASEIMKNALGLDMLYVPYPGEAPGLVATASGVVDATFMNYSGVSSLLGSGKVEVITTMATKRLEQLASVETVGEAGHPDLASGAWQALLAPKGTPPDVVARLNAAANKALANPQAREKLVALGLAPEGGTPAQLGSVLQSDKERYTEIVRKLNIKLD